MRSDQEIKDIVKTKGGYMKLTDEEKTRYSENLKGVDTPKEKLAPDIEELIKEAVARETSHLKQENQKLKEDIGLSQSEWRELKPVKPENKRCQLRKWRNTTDENWKLVVNMKHVRFEWDEETRRYNKDIYRLTLLDYLGDGETSTVEIPYEMLKDCSNNANFEVIEEKKVELAISQGKRPRTATTMDGKHKVYWSPSYNDPNITGRQSQEMVEMIVTRDSGTYTLKCIDKEGQGFILPDFPIEKVNN